jgi:ketosteroid isomerase-like protein
MNTDKAWNDATQQKGYFHSRIDYVADDGIELSNGELPLNGKAAISDYATKNSDSTLKVSWVASKAEVAASGDLGYTYGTYTDQLKTKSGRDTTIYGNYVTVWKKQPDGSWKFLVDGSTNTPKPM